MPGKYSNNTISSRHFENDKLKKYIQPSSPRSGGGDSNYSVLKNESVVEWEKKSSLLQWHKDYLSSSQERFGFSNYQMMWFSWIKGVFFMFAVVIIAYIIWFVKYGSCDTRFHEKCRTCGNMSPNCEC